MEKDMMYRFDQARIIAGGVMRRGMAAVQRRIDSRRIDIGESVLTFFNPSPFNRSGVVTLEVDLPENCGFKGFSLRDENGDALPFAEVGRVEAGTLVRNLQDISLRQCAMRIRLHTDIGDIPALGYRTLFVKRENADVGKRPVRSGSGRDEVVLQNAFLRADIRADGSLDVLDKMTGHLFRGQLYFEDSGEKGHAWTHEAPESDKIVSTLNSAADIRILESCDFLTRVLIKHVMKIPSGLEYSGGTCGRNSDLEEFVIENTVTLRKDQRWLDVVTRLDNQVEQHRLRVCFPTGLKAAVSAAEAAFDVIERPIERTPDSLYFGRPNPQYPMHRFVDISDGRTGLAVLNDGIREFEAVDDENRTLCITLLRAFTAMQSPVIDQWEVYPEMKGAQSIGQHEWRYAIFPHEGDWSQGGVFREAEKFILPIEAAQAGRGGGDLPRHCSFLRVEPAEVVLSAMKRCERRESVILRIYNPADRDVIARVITHLPVRAAWLTNMNEERRHELPVAEKALSVEITHKKILTLEIEFERR
jgi:hypothetical protein